MNYQIANNIVTTMLAIMCMFLVINMFIIYREQKAKESLMETMEGDLQVALDDTTAKDQQIANLTEKVNTMGAEKTKVEEALIKTKSSLESANAAKKALHDEREKMSAELDALKVFGLPNPNLQSL